MVYRAIAAGVAASCILAWVFTKFQVTEEAYEGWTLLVSAAFVLSMVIWMNRSAKGIKGEIETKLGDAGSGWGVFAFVSLMIFREGVETVLLLTAVRLDTSGILELTGTVLGLALAVLFGISFVRGTIRVNLRSFFRITTVILMVVFFQLTIPGLHALSEGQILPSSASEMALIGPIVRDEVFFFIAILALAGAMLLMEWRGRSQPPPTDRLEGAALRKAKWSARRERFWMMASCTAAGLFMLMITAEFIYAKQASELSVPTPLTASAGLVRIPVASVSDGNLHRFSVDSDGVTVRMIVIQRPDKTLATAFDACEICGSKGYFQKGPNVVCRNCASAIFIPTIGVRGGCNPIPIESKVEGTDLIIAADKLFKGARLFRTAS